MNRNHWNLAFKCAFFLFTQFEYAKLNELVSELGKHFMIGHNVSLQSAPKFQRKASESSSKVQTNKTQCVCYYFMWQVL